MTRKRLCEWMEVASFVLLFVGTAWLTISAVLSGVHGDPTGFFIRAGAANGLILGAKEIVVERWKW